MERHGMAETMRIVALSQQVATVNLGLKGRVEQLVEQLSKVQAALTKAKKNAGPAGDDAAVTIQGQQVLRTMFESKLAAANRRYQEAEDRSEKSDAASAAAKRAMETAAKRETAAVERMKDAAERWAGGVNSLGLYALFM